MVFTRNITIISANTTLSLLEDVYLVNAAGGNITITLPNIVCDGIHYKIKRVDATSTTTVTIQGTGGQLIDGVATVTLLPLSVFEVHAYSSAWYILLNSSVTRSNAKTLFTSAFVQNNGSAFITFSKSVTAQLICSFFYSGSSAETISRFVAVLAAESNVTTNLGTVSIRVQGGAVVATVSFDGATTTPTVYTATTIANLPAGPTVFEYVITFAAGSSNNSKVNIFSLTVQ